MAKKEGKEKTSPASIQDIMNMMNAKYGSKVMEVASKAKSASGVRLSSGVLPLDIELGGGWLKGRMHMIVGPFSSGKTLVTTRTISSGQRTCKHCNTPFTSITQTITTEDGEIIEQNEFGIDDPIFSYRLTPEQIDYGMTEDDLLPTYSYDGCDCGENEPLRAVFIDAEGTFDNVWAEHQGVINDELNLISPEFAEQAIDIIEALTRTGMIDLLVIDSVPALVPSAEIEKSAEDQMMGVHARAMGRMVRVLQSAINSLGMDNPNKPVILVINQIREKLGVMFGNLGLELIP